MSEQLTTTSQPEPNADDQGKSQGPLVVGIAVALIVVILVIVIGGAFLATRNPGTFSALRDWFIILVAFMSFVIALALIFLLVELTLLILLLRDEIKPLLVSLNDTMGTVRGTTQFMSDHVTQPAIQVVSAVSGVRRVIEVLAGLRSSVKPKQ